MVLQKRLDYGSSGHQIPPVMPRVPRSAKGKRSVRKKVEEKSMCAFDLLATVAGELLSERESSPALCKLNPTATNDSSKQEQFNEKKPYKAEVFDQGSGNESTVDSGFVFQRQGSHCLKDNPNTLNATAILPAVSDKGAFAGGSLSGGAKDEFGYSHDTNSKKCSSEGCYHGSVESCNCKLDIGIKTPLQTDRKLTGNVASGNGSVMYSMDDPMDLDSKPPALVSSDSSVEVPIARNCSFVKSQNNLDLPVDRDDDENSYGCSPSTKSNKSFRPQRIGDRRIRKLLASKFWKVAPTLMKDADLSNTDAEMKPVFRSRKMCYTRQRTQRGSFKRRKMFERCSIAVSDRGFCGGVVSSLLTKGGIKIEASDSHEIANGANGASSSSTSPKSSYESGDFHVKLSIKSFKVPELFIEIPETATVGSLKRTVMEAVTAILGGGLRVGVLLQGKKVRDDNKTLLQAGISNIDKMDNLGFTLEPNPTQTPPPLASPEDHELLPCDAIEPLNRIPAANPALDQAVSDATLQPPQTLSLNFPDSDHDSVHSPADASSIDKSANSKALVPVPSVSTDALAMVPLRKSRRSELVQRRIRRPFSVSEVEALVQAVEKLGTGRWRDVKLRAFDNAKHRTYVDLKDKWKTLVHTARISPQQRRGEPVPQELLDRVLAAHAYWSQQQAKLQVKPSQAETCLLI